MYSEDDLVPLSALQHFVFCERQCALIHLERAWEENRFTAEGRIFHERVEEGGHETRGDVRVEYGVSIRSFRLGLAGVADVVEFHCIGKGANHEDISDELRPPESKAIVTWLPFPIEYKRGKPKPDRCDEVQLCAQALCLEEMLGILVERGALYYGKTRHRKEVEFDEALRKETEKVAQLVHELLDKGATPKVEYGKKCKSCSLRELCVPKINAQHRSAKQYLIKAIETAGNIEDSG